MGDILEINCLIKKLYFCAYLQNALKCVDVSIPRKQNKEHSIPDILRFVNCQRFCYCNDVEIREKKI